MMATLIFLILFFVFNFPPSHWILSWNWILTTNLYLNLPNFSIISPSWWDGACCCTLSVPWSKPIRQYCLRHSSIWARRSSLFSKHCANGMTGFYPQQVKTSRHITASLLSANPRRASSRVTVFARNPTLLTPQRKWTGANIAWQHNIIKRVFFFVFIRFEFEPAKKTLTLCNCGFVYVSSMYVSWSR